MSEQIPLFKVLMAPEAAGAVAEVLASGYIGQGPQVEQFERDFGRAVGAPEPPLALNSCTSALELALHLCGAGPGTEVISTSLTCTATNGAIVRSGARIVWADCDPTTGLIDPTTIDWLIRDRTAAIMAVDWGGRLCDYLRLKHAGRNVPVIQDAAHSLLAGLGGDYVCWSFQAIKHLTTGDGGALLCPPEQMERARLLRWYGLDRRDGESFRCKQDIREIGFKMHMNDIAAVIGLANLDYARWAVGRHRANAEYYHDALAGLPGITLPPPHLHSSWWLYTLLLDDRDAFIEFMAERGIACSPVHARNDKHTAFRAASDTRIPLPGVNEFAARSVAIPVGWWLSDDDRDRVADAVWNWSRKSADAKRPTQGYRMVTA